MASAPKPLLATAGNSSYSQSAADNANMCNNTTGSRIPDQRTNIAHQAIK